MGALRAPFVYFGGKSRAAALIWERLGNPRNYVEPFCGSLAVLLARPSEPGVETVNDIDGLLVNFWRAVKHNPDEVAEWADYPVTEIDLHARHNWLIDRRDEIKASLRACPDWHDPKAAGWWVWGINAWIGSGWGFSAAQKIPHLLGAGKGVRSRIPHLSDAGTGVHGGACLGEWFGQLSRRLRRVRVCSGDWKRVLTPCVTTRHGVTGVLLDPPYAAGDHCTNMYASYDTDVSRACREWALENGDNPEFRIALCGYAGEHTMPGWDEVPWRGRNGYGKIAEDGTHSGHRERIWFSPHCLGAAQRSLGFDD